MSPTSRSTLLLRGARGQCPCCQSPNVFKSYFRLQETCPACGLPLEQEDGWGLGAIPLNYAFTCVFWILPMGFLFLIGLTGLRTALILAGIGAVVIPFLTYRLSKCIWIGLYYAILPHEIDSYLDKKMGHLIKQVPQKLM